MNVLYSVVIHCSEKLEDIDMIFHLIFIENALYKRLKVLEYNIP